MFVAMLVSSLCALIHVSAVTLVVLRNLSSLVVALGDCIFIGTILSIDVSLCLVGMLVGAVIYGISDVAFTPIGYMWLFVNVISTSAYQIYIKVLVRDENIKKLKAVGMSYYNNVISLPFLGLLSLANREVSELTVRNRPIVGIGSISIMALSGVIGFLASTTAFALNTRISATSLMVLNNANKFLVIIFSEILIERTLGRVSLTGAVVVIIFGYAYANIDRWISAMHDDKRADQHTCRPKIRRAIAWIPCFARTLTLLCLLGLVWLARMQKQSRQTRAV